MPIGSPTGHEVQVLDKQAGDQAWNVARIVLQIAIHGHDNVAASGVDAGLHGRGLTKVAGKAQHPDVRADARCVAQECGAVGCVGTQEEIPLGGFRLSQRQYP